MKREEFIKVAEDALDSLPKEFRSRIIARLFSHRHFGSVSAPTGSPNTIATLLATR
jgi:hypothetical protein